MKKTLLAVCALLLAVGISGTDASAQGMLGKGYLAVGLGQFLAGEDDVRDTDDGVMVVGVEGNVPLLKNLDLTLSGSYSKFEGNPPNEREIISAKTRELWAGATYHFFPETAIDPFVKVSVGYVGYDNDNPYEADAELFKDYAKTYGADGTDNNFAFGVDIGADLPFAGVFAARPAVGYQLIDDEDDFGAMIRFSGWFNKNVVAGLNIAYWADDGDLTYGTMLGFAF